MGKFYEYEILVDDKPIARGQNLKKMWEAARKKYSAKRLAIRYIPPEGILIAIVRL